MKFSGFLSILVLLGLFANIQGLGLTDLLFPRRCPRFREHCELKERDLCSRDRDCQRKEKCCFFNCGKKCLDPQQDICSLPKDSGYCLAYFPRWFYNKENSTCQLFIYGGCQGNNNNFQSQSLCQNVCQKRKTCPRVRIKCEIEERNECTRHRHCPNKKRCCMFSCGKKCLDLKQDVCSLPQDPGPCMAYFPRWWYNKETGVCTEFIYGGCKGNPNNFQTEHICRVVCKKKHLSSWI
ncbi:eppin isoform X1 [Chionomys nivalis]|uniref:eppin isoform X1 n=1 Tax=Chionomys nivalis TaxID=269649 RepID=UPI00259A8DAD|nr:eppin isoform X1 [Chionomys nivalis]